jgi:dihydropteroate synthase
MAVMGILNVTPDSFSDGGQFISVEAAVEYGVRLCEEGADCLDVGGESSRPGAEPVPSGEERRRVVPVIEALRQRVSVPISIDTTKAAVAAAAIEVGANVVNDVSGAADPEMLPLVASTDSAIVLMHRQGTAQTMQIAPVYRDVVMEVVQWLIGRAQAAVDAGVGPSNVLIDPGIGFGKTFEHNLALLREIDQLVATGFPVMIGVSRKSFLGHLLDLPVDQRLEGSIAVAVIAALGGVRVIRVHDVQATVRAVRISEAIGSAECPT